MKQELYVQMVSVGALRGKWEFEYAAKELADAARKQAADRYARRELWKSEYAKVMEKIKESGISVSESVANRLSKASTTYGRGPSLNVDDSLQADLIECHTRIEVHDKAAEEYHAWVAVMKAQGDRRVQLTHADWMYFFGGLDEGE